MPPGGRFAAPWCLESAEDTVARVAEAGHDVGVLVQALVDGAGIDVDIGVVGKHRGESLGRSDKDGELELTLYNEKTLDVFNKYMAYVSDRTQVYSIYHSPDKIEAMFANDQVMFYTRYLCIIKKYREMETDFGILPYPKYDESQDSYYSTIAPYGCSFICVPKVRLAVVNLSNGRRGIFKTQ